MVQDHLAVMIATGHTQVSQISWQKKIAILLAIKFGLDSPFFIANFGAAQCIQLHAPVVLFIFFGLDSPSDDVQSQDFRDSLGWTALLAILICFVHFFFCKNEKLGWISTNVCLGGLFFEKNT